MVKVQNLIDYTCGELFDYALFIGMTSDEYWFGDPSLIYAYQNAFTKRQQYELDMAWTYGAYIKSALSSTQLWTVQPIKDSEWKKMPKYADRPKIDADTHTLTEEEKEAERDRLYKYYKKLAMAQNKNKGG